MQKIDRLDKVFSEPQIENNSVLIESRSDDIGRFILRLAIGAPMLVHGMSKVIYGNQAVGEIISKVGLPNFIASGVFIGEVLAPIMLLLGFKVRLAGFLIAMDMLAAIILVHSSEWTQISPTGGWMIELNALYLLGGIAIMFLGSGHYAVTKGKGMLD